MPGSVRETEVAQRLGIALPQAVAGRVPNDIAHGWAQPRTPLGLAAPFDGRAWGTAGPWGGQFDQDDECIRYAVLSGGQVREYGPVKRGGAW